MPVLTLPHTQGMGRLSVEYDDRGYTILVDGAIVSARRLEPICYQMDVRKREQIALSHALSDIRCELPDTVLSRLQESP